MSYPQELRKKGIIMPGWEDKKEEPKEEPKEGE